MINLQLQLSFDPADRLLLERLVGSVENLEKGLVRLVAEIDDLNAAVTVITTAVTDVSTELKSVADALVALKGSGNPIDPAAVEAAAQSIQTLAGSLEQAVSAAKTETGS